MTNYMASRLSRQVFTVAAAWNLVNQSSTSPKVLPFPRTFG